MDRFVTIEARSRSWGRRRTGLGLAGLLAALLSGCATPTPFYLVESRLVESPRTRPAPDVTETPTFRAVRSKIATVGLRPPDVCADQGAATREGAAQLQQGVLRTRCGVEMAQLERALARAGYQVVSWSAVQQMAKRQDKPMLEAAAALNVDVLLQVNALERIDIAPPRDARWERSFFLATREGEARGAAAVSAERAEDFNALVGNREARVGSNSRVGAAINVSGVWVASGATIWFYEWTVIDEIVPNSEISVLVDCEETHCSEVEETHPEVSSAPVAGSISGVSRAGDPADLSQAIFSDLVRDLVLDLAERFAGRRS